jgi:hypothetical protein
MHSLKLRLLFSATVVAVVLASCKSSPRNVESPIATASPQAQNTPAPAVKLPPPTRAEVDEKVRRIFGDAVTVEHGAHQYFIVGDFNGDDSEDLAVIVRPAADKLADVNGEVANWIIQDADSYFVAQSAQRVVKANEVPPQPRIVAGEQVLAILHGYGPNGWRNPEARQSYLVKHAAATFLGTSRSTTQQSIRMMHLPAETDIIQELRRNKKGFLFWTGGAYAWHPSAS